MNHGELCNVDVTDGQQLSRTYLNFGPAPAKRLKTVSNAQDSRVLELLFQHFLKQRFRFLVQIGSRFI